MGRYLLHPGQETSHFVHHVLRVLAQVGHDVLPVVIGVAAAVAAWKMARVAIRFRRPGAAHLVEVRLSASLDPKGSLALWRTLYSVLSTRRGWLAPAPHVAFEMEGSYSGISLRFWVPAEASPLAVVRAVESACPGSQCEIGPATSPVLSGKARVGGEMRLAHPAWRSICTDHAGDPLRTVIGALAMGGDGEHAVVQVLVRPAGSRQLRSLAGAVRRLHSGKPTTLVPRLIAAWRTTPVAAARPDPFRAVEVHHAVDKLSDLPLFDVSIRFGLCSDVERRRRLRSHARQVGAAFGVYARDNHFVCRRPLGWRWRLERRLFGHGQLLGLSEVAALAHLPYGEAIPGLVYASATPVAPPPGVLTGPASERFNEDGDDGWL